MFQNIYIYFLPIYISPPIFFENICPWSTKSVISSTGIFVATAKKNIVWVKMIQFYFMTKIIRILISCSMKIFCTVNISKHNSNMHCKELHLNNFKDDFLNIWIFFCTLRFQIFKYCPNHTSMEILFIQRSDDI